jgi:regulator of protease activity HflC (stomatin/prohibitin superfamily)
MRRSIGALLFIIFLGAAAGSIALQAPPAVAAVSAVIGFFMLFSVYVVAEWERAVILRMGKYSGIKGSGPFMIIPVIDTVVYIIDQRVITSPFTAEQTLTRDGVPVDVDAVLFWKVTDPEKAALQVENYQQAVNWAAQTALREVIGKTPHEVVLSTREKLDQELQDIIHRRTQPWGIEVISVEIRDIVIPEGLQGAMSMQAQAQRELQARVVLGDSEVQIAKKFDEASQVYVSNPTALHLRAMNMLYEGLKQKGALVIVPSTAVETMGLGTLSGLSALSKEFMQQRDAEKPKT